MEIDNSRWVYIMVQRSGTTEQIVAQVDTRKQINFVPTFLNKEAAQQAALNIPGATDKEVEIQAIIFEDLSHYASSNDFLIFILDENGKILSKPMP